MKYHNRKTYFFDYIAFFLLKPDICPYLLYAAARPGYAAAGLGHAAARPGYAAAGLGYAGARLGYAAARLGYTRPALGFKN